MPFPNETIPPEDPAEAPVVSEELEAAESANQPGIMRVLLDVFETLVLALVLYFAIDAMVARVRVLNISMQPTLVPGEFVMVNKLAYKFGEIGRGDIVVFHYDEREDYVKRVIGLPGDEVEVRDGIVYISDVPLIEPYIRENPTYVGKWTVPRGELFVLGDNRNQSSDSHSWGFVPIEEVVGRAIMIYWPPAQARIFTRQ